MQAREAPQVIRHSVARRQVGARQESNLPPLEHRVFREYRGETRLRDRFAEQTVDTVPQPGEQFLLVIRINLAAQPPSKVPRIVVAWQDDRGYRRPRRGRVEITLRD